MQTITGELRKWHRERVVEKTGCVIGLMYNDTKDIYEDGDPCVLYFTDWVESANFFLAITANHTCVKCPKDEEVMNGPRVPTTG